MGEIDYASFLCRWRQLLLWFAFIPSHSATEGLLVSGCKVLGRFAAGWGMICLSSRRGGSLSPRARGLSGSAGSELVYSSVCFVALK